jgi:peptide-methionine (S)-S-oxide reductase
MGNALSGSERWPVRHESAKAFAAMAEGETLTVGAGCYWGTEKWYAKHFAEDWKTNGDGAVLATAVGFMGPPGVKPNPTYREVCSGTTGHVEVCQIRYDSTKTTYEDLVSHLFTFHDPTTANRQGNDVGSQYASVIFTHDETQKETADKGCAQSAGRAGRRAKSQTSNTPTKPSKRESNTRRRFTPRTKRTKSTWRRNPRGTATIAGDSGGKTSSSGIDATNYEAFLCVDGSRVYGFVVNE